MNTVEDVAAEAQGLLTYRFPPFRLVLQGITNSIATFSDIHGDIDALLVCLRDCAQVIHKPGYDPQTGRDPELEHYLQMDINDPTYDRSLGYEWRSGNTSYVVIIGDLIDPIRNRGTIIEPIYYRQVEFKIIHFINAMNESALRKYQELYPNLGVQVEVPSECGRIYKLLGNHDILNFIAYNPAGRTMVQNYTFPEDIPLPTFLNRNPVPPVYYSTDMPPIADITGNPDPDRVTNLYHYTRQNIFNYTSPGFNAYFETTGTGCFLLINDNLFVHGGLQGQENIVDIITCHEQFINSVTNPITENAFVRIVARFLNLLQSRHYSSDNRDARFPGQTREEDIITCEEFAAHLVRFCNVGGAEHCGAHPERIRMFKGHCNQRTNMRDSTVLSGFVQRTGTTEIYSNFIDGQRHPNAYYHGPRMETADELNEDNIDLHHEHNRTWGVTFSCDRNTNRALQPRNHQNPQIIKIDVGMGRGQDYLPINRVFETVVGGVIPPREVEVFGHRVPQIIVIPAIGEDEPERLFLVRSTLRNTARHMPRINYSTNKNQVIASLPAAIQQNEIDRITARVNRSVYGRKTRTKTRTTKTRTTKTRNEKKKK
jgi:hypothetical protein